MLKDNASLATDGLQILRRCYKQRLQSVNFWQTADQANSPVLFRRLH